MSEDEPVVAGRAPMAVALEEGQTVWWCACGRSGNQPFCDGSHVGTSFTPVQYTADRARKVYSCVCKHTGRPPVCDGSHKNL